uniref:GH16 domain-containing protein n=1 Tax=Aureoumbra lagunensis TaxID=44058 RepID=A0A7S3K4P5_9STRA
MALHYYHSDRVKTSNGVLNITTMYKPTSFDSYEDSKGYIVVTHRRKGYSSGLVQTWNKFCFTGGIVEIRARLPGKAKVGGLWPAMWLLGALSRATYVGSTDWIWPWSYNKCDRALQKQQEINACEPNPHYGLGSSTGRGAPEIDLLEAMPGDETLNYGLQKPYFSASYQVAPGKLHDRPVEGKLPYRGQWYSKGLKFGANTTLNAFFYGTTLKHPKKGQTYIADAISANRHLHETHFDDFHTWRLEWSTKEGQQSIRWYLDNEFIFQVLPETLDMTGANMPDEPMHILLNTAVSSTWGFPAPCPAGCTCECFDCGNPKCACGMPQGMCANLPAYYEIDYVRVYQDMEDNSHKIGCSTDSKPTKRFIQGHLDRYYDYFNNERQPLKPLQHGGGSCSHHSDCFNNYGTQSLFSDSKCIKNKCVCGKETTGPHCAAFKAYDDQNWDVPYDLSLHSPFLPSSLLRVLIALIAVAIALVTVRLLSQQAARKAAALV